MKAIILAGESGTRLHPLTQGIPKPLLPIYDRPMIYYPIETLTTAGVTEILIITAPQYVTMFQQALGDGSKFNATFIFVTQSEPKGIAEALTIGKDFIGDSSVILITGDTLFVGEDISMQINKAIRAIRCSGSATIFVKRDPDEEQYGKVLLNRMGKWATIVGTSDAFSSSSITGLYIFPNNAVERASNLNKSERGRYEITDIINQYLIEKKLQIITLGPGITWLDTNSYESLLRASQYIYLKKKNI